MCCVSTNGVEKQSVEDRNLEVENAGARGLNVCSCYRTISRQLWYRPLHAAWFRVRGWRQLLQFEPLPEMQIVTPRAHICLFAKVTKGAEERRSNFDQRRSLPGHIRRQAAHILRLVRPNPVRINFERDPNNFK